MNLHRKMPLYIITGASCVGKSTACQVLLNNETDYIVLESDLLWNEIYNTPEDDYHQYRELWLNICANISQIGKPVVLCGCATPKQFEQCEARKLFTEIRYLAVFCENDVLDNRIRNGRFITDEKWINSSIHFNRWLCENADKTEPKIKLVDTTNLTPQKTADRIDHWILSFEG